MGEIKYFSFKKKETKSWLNNRNYEVMVTEKGNTRMHNSKCERYRKKKTKIKYTIF